MYRLALLASVAASLLFAGMAHAETTPPGPEPEADKPPPKSAQPTTPRKTDKVAKPDTNTAGKTRRVTYACDDGVNVVVSYPPEAKSQTDRVRIVSKDKWAYALRPTPGGQKWEHKTLKVVFQPKGDEATFEREGKPLAEKCKISKTST